MLLAADSRFPASPLDKCTAVPAHGAGIPSPAPSDPAVPLARGEVLLAPSSGPCLLPRSFTILCPGEAGAGRCWLRPLHQQRSEARARTGGCCPAAGWVPRPWGGAQHLCLLGKGTTGVSAPLPLGQEVAGARSRDSGLSVPSRSAGSPYVPLLARCWAGAKFGTRQPRPMLLGTIPARGGEPTVCAKGETEAGAGGSHGRSRLLQVASEPSARLWGTSSGHWK